MQKALRIVRAAQPDLMIDGEMQADVALSEKTRLEIMPKSTLKGEANLFIMPNIDAANISFNMMKIVGDAGYTGFVGIEYEGSKLSEADGIKATKKLLEKIRSGK